MSIDALIGDAWRREEFARSKPYPPPIVAIDDYSTDNCVCVQINREWIPFITGVLAILVNPNLWAHETWDYAPQEIIKLIEALMGASNSMSCGGQITNITFEGGSIIIHRGETTETVAGSDSIVTGIEATGTGWAFESGGQFTEVPNGNGCGNCDLYPDKPAYNDTGAARSCNIATNLVEYIMEKYQDSLDAAEAAVDTVAAADAILAIFPPAYLAWDATTDAVNEFFEATINIARALDTVGLREDMKEFLYCQLIANSHVMNEGIWDNFKNEFALIGDSIFLYLGAFKYGGIENQAAKASYGTASGCETFPCNPEGSYLDEFDGGFGVLTYQSTDVGIPNYYGSSGDDGVYAPEASHGIGGSVVTTVPDGFPNKRSISMFIDLGQEKSINEVSMWLKMNTSGKNYGANIALFDGSKTLVAHAVNATFSSHTTWTKRGATGTWAAVRYIRYGVVVDVTTPATAPTYMDDIFVKWNA